jgi:hypothetical protein
VQTDPLQVAAAGGRAALQTFLTEAAVDGGPGSLGWSTWAGYLAEALRSLLQAIPAPPAVPDPAEMNDILDPGRCNWPLGGALCQRDAGHSGDCCAQRAVSGPGQCNCGAHVDAQGKVTQAGAR